MNRRSAAPRYVGINLKGPPQTTTQYRRESVAGNANDLSMFEDGSVDAVLTNAMLEQHKAFWLTISEVRRVVRPGRYF
jgi:ubiquinone/menaquinone biosynthesis C-methylase UbiE